MKQIDPIPAYLSNVAADARRFPNALRVGDAIYASSQPVTETPPLNDSADIRDQTHAAFRSLVSMLESLGARMSDLVKLHTFYVFEGESDTTAYWERMTEVRLQYFANPGPCGTALRIKGAPVSDRLIAIDGIARVDAERQRIMPAHAWDWSMPTPLSQGWRVGTVIYAGGQISADRRGRTVAPDDVSQQTVNTMEFLRHVLLDAGADFEHIVSLKIAYQHQGDDAVARTVLDNILATVRPLLRHGQCTLTCLGVDLIYERLKLEIDAMAVVPEQGPVQRTGVDRGWCGAPGFASACRTGGLIHVGAIGAPEGSSIEAQLRSSLERLGTALDETGSLTRDLVKLNVLYTSSPENEAGDYETLYSVLDTSLPKPGPVLTLVRVAGLPQSGQRVQVDAVAIVVAT